jgi:RNA polymerase sigma-70 factor (ECF subfamily)
MIIQQQDFASLYTEYYPKIAGYLRRLVGEADAEDVAQEVFVKVSRSLEGFRGESSLSTWIYRIATNAALDHRRTPSSRQASITTDIPDENNLSSEELTLLQSSAPRIDVALIRKDMNDCIRGLVNDLPENHRIVLMLGELEGCSNAEIAEILDVSLDTVKIRMHRARRQLKKSMDVACHLYRDDRNELSCDRRFPSLEFRKK